VTLREQLAGARLYYVSDEVETLPAAIAGGIDLFQLRMKDAPDARVLERAEQARALCRAGEVLFLVNDRPDLAVAAGADGVHVGQDDAGIPEARAFVGPERLIGRSTHAPADLAGATGADYVAAGPVHATPTKAGRPAAGIEYVEHAARNAGVPWFAIGGLDAGNVGEVLRAGARRIVVVRAIRDAADPEAAARGLREALDAVPLEVQVGTP
jgi:thiamine-phosphate pyrophosphorylase